MTVESTVRRGSYSSLSQDESESSMPLLFEEEKPIRLGTSVVQSRAVFVLAILSASLALSTLLLAGLWLRALAGSNIGPQILYSPATEAIEYEVVKFHSGPLNNEEDDIYSLPPSPEVDAAWRDLYEVGIVSLTDLEASSLVNATLKQNGKYLVGIDVFHQLHCLNKIRKALYPDYYKNDTETVEVHGLHITHCLNSIRQSLQCSSDISTVVFEEQSIERIHSEVQRLPSFNILHSCRSFDKIKSWTQERWSGDYLDGE